MTIVGLDVGYSNLKIAVGEAGTAPQVMVRPAGAAPLNRLREASTSAIAALASSPVAIHKMRLPKQAASTVLAACNEMRWLGPIHLAMTAVEKTRGRSG